MKPSLQETLSLPGLFLKLFSANRQVHAEDYQRVSFGSQPAQYLLFFPADDPRARHRPLIFFLHGGGWRQGNPQQFRFIGQFFAHQGFHTVLGGYRLAPRFRHPAQLEDAYTGLQAGLAAARERGWEGQTFLLAGQSAGAQLAALMLYQPGGLRQHRLRPERCVGLLAISGPLDFSHYSQNLAGHLRDYIGPASEWPQADPAQKLQGDETTPVLLVHGGQDPLVPLAASQSFAERLNRAGQPVAQVIVLPAGLHANLVLLFVERSAAQDAMLTWLRDIAGRRAQVD